MCLKQESTFRPLRAPGENVDPIVQQLLEHDSTIDKQLTSPLLSAFTPSYK